MVDRSVAQALLAPTTGLLDELGLDRPHVAGNSLGGRLALELAVAGRASSVTAFSPAGFWRTDRELSYARAVNKVMQVGGELARPIAPVVTRSTVGRALIYAEIVSRPSRVTPQQATGDLEAFLNARAAMNAILAAATPFTGTIPGAVPVTIAWGTRDRLLRPRQAFVAKGRLPHARIIRLAGCGHVPMTDDPRLVADVLLDGSRETGRVGRPVDVGLARATKCCIRRATRRYGGGAAPPPQPCHRRRLRPPLLPEGRSSSPGGRHGTHKPASRACVPPCAAAGPG
jgi:pimeloyl-ACP methyl ester carboxylesterase